MNAAFVHEISDVLNDSSLRRPWERHGFSFAQVSPLLAELHDDLDTLEGSQRSSMQWAALLGAADWFEWRRLR